MNHHSFISLENDMQTSSKPMEDYDIFLKSMANFDYLQDISEKRRVFNNAIQTVSNFSRRDSKNKKSILVVGKVQSGKTTNFTGVTALAMDIRMDIIIILGGTNSALLKQNYERITETLSDNTIKFFDKSDFESPFFNSDLVLKQIESGYKVVFIVMKESQNLKKVYDLLHMSTASGSNLLIIDDEADLASVSNDSTKQKSINKLIKGLYYSCDTSTYVAYTATPQGNLMSNSNLWQSPDYINYIMPPSIYCGLSKFHIPMSKNVKLFEESNLIQEAINQFLIDSFIVKFISNYKKTIDMIIHIERFNEENANLYDVVHKHTKEMFLKVHRHSDLSLFNNNRDYIESYIQCDLSKFLKFVSCNIQDLRLPVKFFNPQEFGIMRSKPEDGHINIIIGAEMLGRGVTFNALTTLILRESKIFSMDTMLQRARWFGYREENLSDSLTFFNLMKIYTTEKIKKVYETIYFSDKALWACLDFLKATNLNQNCKKVNIPLLGYDDLTPCSKEKLGKKYLKSKFKKEYVFKLKIDLEINSSVLTYSKIIELLSLYVHDYQLSLELISLLNFNDMKFAEVRYSEGVLVFNINTETRGDVYVKN